MAARQQPMLRARRRDANAGTPADGAGRDGSQAPFPVAGAPPATSQTRVTSQGYSSYLVYGLFVALFVSLCANVGQAILHMRRETPCDRIAHLVDETANPGWLTLNLKQRVCIACTRAQIERAPDEARVLMGEGALLMLNDMHIRGSADGGVVLTDGAARVFAYDGTRRVYVIGDGMLEDLYSASDLAQLPEGEMVVLGRPVNERWHDYVSTRCVMFMGLTMRVCQAQHLRFAEYRGLLLRPRSDGAAAGAGDDDDDPSVPSSATFIPDRNRKAPVLIGRVPAHIIAANQDVGLIVGGPVVVPYAVPKVDYQCLNQDAGDFYRGPRRVVVETWQNGLTPGANGNSFLDRRVDPLPTGLCVPASPWRTSLRPILEEATLRATKAYTPYDGVFTAPGAHLMVIGGEACVGASVTSVPDSIVVALFPSRTCSGAALARVQVRLGDFSGAYAIRCTLYGAALA